MAPKCARNTTNDNEIEIRQMTEIIEKKQKNQLSKKKRISPYEQKTDKTRVKK